MGAWGYNAFENDAAADWLAALKQSDIVSFTEDALQAALPSPLALMQRQAGKQPEVYLDANVACVALVAAEVVAAWGGKPHAAMPDDLSSALTRSAAEYDTELAALAQMAVKGIAEDSELRDLWEETDDFGAWLQDLRDLESRLMARGSAE